MRTTIDVTGLPESVVHDIEQLVASIRDNLALSMGNGQAGAELSPDEWIRQFRDWAVSHPRRQIQIDDSRESIYEGRGE